MLNENIKENKILNLRMFFYKFMKLKLLKKITIYIMSVLYVSVGTKHFTDPEFFLAIVPPFLLFKIEIVYLSGILEILRH